MLSVKVIWLGTNYSHIPSGPNQSSVWFVDELYGFSFITSERCLHGWLSNLSFTDLPLFFQIVTFSRIFSNVGVTLTIITPKLRLDRDLSVWEFGKDQTIHLFHQRYFHRTHRDTGSRGVNVFYLISQGVSFCFQSRCGAFTDRLRSFHFLIFQ